MKNLDKLEESPARESQPPGNRDAFQSDSCVGLYLRDIRRVKRLTRKEEIDLATRTRNGDMEAREQMIMSNLPLVIKIACAYQGIGLPLLDLISEGNIGLMRAVERFDPRRGVKFSGYGALWIKQAITNALASQAKSIRLPTHVIGKLSKMRRASSRLEEELGREPTDEELASEMGTSPRRVTEMRMVAIRPASLDAQIGDEGIGSYAETLADEKAVSPYEELEGKARKAVLQETIQTLNSRERAIVRLRFGFEGESPETLDEIGDKLGVSSERVRQLQKTALNKLRCRLNNRENCVSFNGRRAAKGVRQKLKLAKRNSRQQTPSLCVRKHQTCGAERNKRNENAT